MKKQISKVEDSYKNHLVNLIFGPLIKILEAIFDLLIPLFMKAIIDLNLYSNPTDIPNSISSTLANFIRLFGTWVPGNQKLSDAIIGGTIILVMSILGFIVTMIAQYVAAATAVSVASELRISLYSKILGLSKKDKERIGNSYLQTVLNNDIYQVEKGVQIFIRLIARAPLIILGSIIFCFILDWRIGLVFAFIAPIIVVSLLLILRKSERNYVSIQKDLDDISNKTSDNIEGVRVVKAFDANEYEINKFEVSNNRYEKESLKVQKNNAFINPIVFELTSLVTIFILFILMATLFNSSDEIKVILTSTIIAAMAYLAQIFFATAQLSGVLLDLTKAKVSRRRINKVYEVQDSIVKSDIKNQQVLSKELIKFDDVSFSFDESNEHLVLSNVSFSFDKGETIGIIGGTGSGKSTIINLIERFYDPNKGNIFYKGINLKEFNLEDLRNEIGLVNQKSFLFNGTIKENLLMSNPLASDEQIFDALKKAAAYDFVKKLPNDINYVIKEGGTNVSGGQRQRLCIARALIKNLELLIFDDSTSALDLLTDRQIRNTLKEMTETSKIIVSQRVSSILDCDKIIVVDRGMVVGIGTHIDLLNSCQIYKEIAISQGNNE